MLLSGKKQLMMAWIPSWATTLGCWLIYLKVVNLLVANRSSKENKSTIRLLIDMTSIHNLIIHQMDVKTTILNGKLKEEVYMNQPQGFIMPGNENKVDLIKEFLSSRFSMKDMEEADVILALAAAGKETEWLKNLLLEISLWVKPITPISIRCDSAATLTKAYSQMYNGKSRHLDVRHNMIRELITNGVAGETGKSSPSLSHPPGFTPDVLEDQNDNEAKNTLESLNAKVMGSSQEIPTAEHNDQVSQKGINNGGSVLGVMEDVIRVGQAMGYSMEGCVKDLAAIIGKQGEENVFR
nr:zinc finger, CCHC-type [Tanacetum cinerariifolium]